MGDCLEVMPQLDVEVDLVLTDPPYGTTACKWDSIIPFEPMWQGLAKLVKPNRAIALFAQNPFAAKLIGSNISSFKHEFVWQKNAGSNFGCVKFQPMREHETILVFCKGSANYYPQMEARKGGGLARVTSGVVNYATKTENYGVALRGQVSSARPKERYPSSVQKFNRERGLHPTQKPVALMEYLIKTYTLETELVLDFTIGSGTTAIACENLGRRWIGIEKEEKYCDIAIERLKNEAQHGLF